jgi:hypothetical protein
LIRGYVNPLNNTASLDPVWQTLAPTPPFWPESGEFSLHLFDTDGAALFTGSFAPETRIDADPAPLFRANGPFWFGLPLSDRIGAVEVRRAGQTLLRRELSAHAPEVHLLAPLPGTVVTDSELRLEWGAADADNDPLAFAVDVSSDGGMNWNTLAYNLGATGLTVSTASLPGGATTLFRVTANDGLRQSWDQVAITIADRPPVLEILSPAADAVFSGDAPIHLAAWANDPEDGPLDGERVSWDSEQDGVLGSGAVLVIDPAGWSEGMRVIRATATDSARHQVATSITVTVQRGAGPVLDGAIEGDDIRLTWPAAFDAWQVEATLDLGLPYWFAVSGDLDASGDPIVLRVPLTDDNLFFRLVTP